MKLKITLTGAEFKTIIANHFGLSLDEVDDVEVFIDNNKDEDLEDERRYQEWQDKLAADYDSNNYEDLIYNIDNLLANGMKLQAIREYLAFTKFSLGQCKYAVEKWPETKDFFYSSGYFAPYNKCSPLD